MLIAAGSAFCPAASLSARPSAPLRARHPAARRRHGPCACSSPLITLAETEAAAARLGCRLVVQSTGPAYKLELLWDDAMAGQMIGGAPSRPDLLGSTEGFSQPNGVVHLENIQIRRFTGYWRRSWSRRYQEAPRLERQGLGLLLSVAIFAWINERDPFKCRRAQLLASPACQTHARRLSEPRPRRR